MKMFAVYVKDCINGSFVCVGDFLDRAEASELRRYLEKWNCADIVVMEWTKKGLHEV